jgi:hypothetical protein
MIRHLMVKEICAELELLPFKEWCRNMDGVSGAESAELARYRSIHPEPPET